jgi:hypothetical protein
MSYSYLHTAYTIRSRRLRNLHWNVFPEERQLCCKSLLPVHVSFEYVEVTCK